MALSCVLGILHIPCEAWAMQAGLDLWPSLILEQHCEILPETWPERQSCKDPSQHFLFFSFFFLKYFSSAFFSWEGLLPCRGYLEAVFPSASGFSEIWDCLAPLRAPLQAMNCLAAFAPQQQGVPSILFHLLLCHYPAQGPWGPGAFDYSLSSSMPVISCLNQRELIVFLYQLKPPTWPWPWPFAC